MKAYRMKQEFFSIRGSSPYFEQQLLAKFRVGDVIVGNEKANVYSITKPGTVYEVLEVISEGTLKVRCGRHTFYVEAHCFDIVESPRAEEDDVYDEFLLSYGLG